MIVEGLKREKESFEGGGGGKALVMCWNLSFALNTVLILRGKANINLG